MSSQRPAASLLTKRVFQHSARKPRFASSLQAMLLRLFPVRCDTRNATWGAGPLSGRYSAALTRPKGTNSGWLWAEAGDAAVTTLVRSAIAPKKLRVIFTICLLAFPPGYPG